MVAEDGLEEAELVRLAAHGLHRADGLRLELALRLRELRPGHGLLREVGDDRVDPLLEVGRRLARPGLRLDDEELGVDAPLDVGLDARRDLVLADEVALEPARLATGHEPRRAVERRAVR